MEARAITIFFGGGELSNIRKEKFCCVFYQKKNYQHSEATSLYKSKTNVTVIRHHTLN